MAKHTLKTGAYSCPLIAAHQVGHSYGVEKFADDTYQSRGAMYNKLNPDNDSNHLYLRDAILLTEKANNDAILEAWCHQRGGVFVRLPDAVACDEELSDQLMRVSEELGAALGEVRAARSDGVIDPSEFETIKTRLMNTITEALALKTVIKGQVRDLPRHPSVVIGKS
ncbi:phage regulatory CII family protein [Rheinheimera sp.]|uniref:phage regulatory CII family protein n=1 Tax=Rheinheimera sp. TaxID=1869214 RepID=UPI002735D419|nr:phage regulatory CII family protein [Rheinheimera sp.]MDP2715517.1 hypothetical protein [Rheinheimera sp.]